MRILNTQSAFILVIKPPVCEFCFRQMPTRWVVYILPNEALYVNVNVSIKLQSETIDVVIVTAIILR